ncbi:hypothetical protein K431DRAFT_31857 [Polychaeton citri CBS 116435]|uniref:Secreted protein n=1 Tax=Polychaeton citri CBS 116435 TaxID=1314669 RepID=A0A9P4URS1_9PEZI|nr:hypothetical protein K431DRAFT_31857 [Polychaeton citri CBS 116435]
MRFLLLSFFLKIGLHALLNLLLSHSLSDVWSCSSRTMVHGVAELRPARQYRLRMVCKRRSGPWSRGAWNSVTMRRRKSVQQYKRKEKTFFQIPPISRILQLFSHVGGGLVLGGSGSGGLNYSIYSTEPLLALDSTQHRSFAGSLLHSPESGSCGVGGLCCLLRDNAYGTFC